MKKVMLFVVFVKKKNLSLKLMIVQIARDGFVGNVHRINVKVHLDISVNRVRQRKKRKRNKNLFMEDIIKKECLIWEKGRKKLRLK